MAQQRRVRRPSLWRRRDAGAPSPPGPLPALPPVPPPPPATAVPADPGASLRARTAELDEELRKAHYDARRLERRRRELAVVVAGATELIAATRADLDRVSSSTTWRVVHRLARASVALRGRPLEGDGALAKAIERLDAADLTPRPAAPAPAAPKAPAVRERRHRRDIGERAARERFLTHYRAVTASADDASLGDTLAIDRLGVLAASERSPAAVCPSVDVVICVHDAVEDVRRCLWAVLQATGRAIHVILVDDGSGAPTRAVLAEFVARHPDVTLIVNDEGPHGYTYAANIGLRATTADWVVFLNSDTVVTRGWLDRLLAAGESDPAIGLVGPLSNAATLQSVPEVRRDGAWAVNELPPWLTPDAMAFLVARGGGAIRPRVPFLNGFCLAVRRGVVEAIGEFDEETFGRGYCEENDYALRAAAAGFSLVVADDAYVHHRKSRSYGTDGRAGVAPEHFRALLGKHGERHVRGLAAGHEADGRLDALRARLAELLAAPEALVEAFPVLCPDPLRIAFVLPNLAAGGSGGAHSVYQEASGMRRLGIDAVIAIAAPAFELARQTYADADEVFVAFDGAGDLLRRTADREVVVATHFKSVALVAELHRGRADFLPAYYVQDYEPFFFANVNGGSADAAEARASYGVLPGMLLFAKTHWLANVVGIMHGRPVAKVEPSIDESLFNAVRREQPEGGPVRVTAMVRPRTWRRQPAATVALLERLQSELGDRVSVVSFGCTDEALKLMCRGRVPPLDHRGVLTRDEVAELHCDTDVFLDYSVFQAMGRTAFEAMCCGCAAALTRVGGPYEFARHGENAMLLDPLDDEAAYRTVVELVSDAGLRRRLGDQGALEARRRSVLGAVLSEYVLFEHEHHRRDLPRIAPQAAAGPGAAESSNSSAHRRIARRRVTK